MELDKLWTGNIGDIAHGYCIDSFLSDTELGRIIRLRQQVTGEFFLLTVLKKQTNRFGREEADFLLEQMRFASEHFRHGNLQQIPLCGTFRDQRFFIVQECPYTLTQYIKASGGKLIAPIALHIVFQILDALEFLHHIPVQESGTERTCVTHDYLIPEHILLTDDGFTPTVKLSAQHKLYLGRDDDNPLYGDSVQFFYLPVEAWLHSEKTGRIKTNLWTVTALLHSMLTGLPDLEDHELFMKKLKDKSAFPAVNRRNLSVPQSLAKLIDTVLAQRDFPYDLTASEYKSMLKESAEKPYIRPARVDDDDDFLLVKTDLEDVVNVFCTDALVISSTATPVPDADMSCKKQPDFTSDQDAVPPVPKQEYLPRGTRLFDAFEITSDKPETNDFGWYRYSARRVQPETAAQECTVILATRHYKSCFERIEQWRRLEHPNIRRMLAMGLHAGDTLAMAFEGSKNESDIWLKNMVSLRNQDWASFVKNILDTTLGCARGLHFLHQNKLIHGDIKPSNLYRHGVNIKLDGLWMPENGGYTPAYASTEQFEGRAIDESTDVWSLGVTLVELLLGDRQWSKGPVCSLVYEEHLRIRCKPLPEILWSILRGCLRTDSSKRMCVNELIDLLERNRLDT